jgi:hypothetical protein
MVNGALNMKHLYKAFYGALLVLGLAGIYSVPAMAADGYRYDSACNCMRPESEYTTRHVERAPARVVTHQRVVNRTRVVRGKTRLIQENHLVVHVRPVINREVVVHRTNTVVRDVVLHRRNTVNKWRNEYHRQVVNRYVPGTVRHVVERREVRGINCNCGNEGDRYSGREYSGDREYYGGSRVVSYRD